MLSQQLITSSGQLTNHTLYPAKTQSSLNALLNHLPPWLCGLAISGRGAVKAWLAIRQGVGSYPTPAGMSSQIILGQGTRGSACVIVKL